MTLFVTAAKLGRRSHKMRELISEATRTVEDSQTAQALHGLLSLKSPADCPPSATSTISTSVSDLSMALIPQSSAGLLEHQAQIQAAMIHNVNAADSVRSPAKSLSRTATSSKSVDRHATLRAAILSPSAASVQPADTGAAGSVVQMLLQMQQDDATPAVKGRQVRARVASSTPAGNIFVVPATSSVDLNASHLLPDRSVPARIGATSSTAKSPSAVSVPLSSIVQVSDSSARHPVPIQLIATSQGVLAIPQNYKLVAQNAVAAAASGVSAQLMQPATSAVASLAKKRPSLSSAGGLLKIAKLQTAATQSQRTDDTVGSAVQSEPAAVVANSLPHTVDETVQSDASSLPNQPLQTAIRDNYEKLFWKVCLQSSSFRMQRPPDEAFTDGNEVSLRPECIKCSCVIRR